VSEVMRGVSESGREGERARERKGNRDSEEKEDAE
jgi:hypothetical protein